MINPFAFTQAVKYFGYLVNIISRGIYRLTVTVTDVAFMLGIIVGSVVVLLLGKLENIFKDSVKIVGRHLRQFLKP